MEACSDSVRFSVLYLMYSNLCTKYPAGSELEKTVTVIAPREIHVGQQVYFVVQISYR